MTYNGWTNYATWLANLHLGHAFTEVLAVDIEDGYCDPFTDVDDLEAYLKSEALELVQGSCANGIVAEFACAFLDDVNWRELAEAHAEDFPNLVRSEVTA